MNAHVGISCLLQPDLRSNISSYELIRLRIKSAFVHRATTNRVAYISNKPVELVVFIDLRLKSWIETRFRDFASCVTEGCELCAPYEKGFRTRLESAESKRLMDLIRHAPRLDYFAVYSPLLGHTEETQHEQILYYSARDEESSTEDAKMRRIGLAQALVNFSSVFSSNRPCESVQTRKNRMVLYEPEPGYWMLLNVNLGYVTAPKSNDNAKQKTVPKSTVVEYLDSELSDLALREVLKMSYQLYKLYNGTFLDCVAEQSLEILKDRLTIFFQDRIWKWDFDRMDVISTMNAMSYFPLTRSQYTNIQSFVGEIESTFDVISATMLLLRPSYLVWAGLREQEDVNSVYRDLVERIAAEDEREREPKKRLEREKREKAKKSRVAEGIVDGTERDVSKKGFSFSRTRSSWSQFFGLPNFSRSSSWNQNLLTSSVQTSTAIETTTLVESVTSSFPREQSSSSTCIIPTEEDNSDLKDAVEAPSHSTRFLLGAPDLENPHDPVSVQKWYIGKILHYVVIYKYEDKAYLVFFLPTSSPRAALQIISHQFYKTLDVFLRPKLSEILRTIIEPETDNPPSVPSAAITSILSSPQLSNSPIPTVAASSAAAPHPEHDYYFLYYNRMTKAIRSSFTVCPPRRKKKTDGKKFSALRKDPSAPWEEDSLTVSAEVGEYLMDLRESFARRPQDTEICARSISNYWVAARRTEETELYVVVPRKNKTLIEVEEEIRRVKSVRHL